uniref:Uncharacterized protein n=1 Tax=Spironucleus salmonicida TaxID=348837 RepID=V6LF68_9EUKA|eukprot:EST42331.1 Hypothetical protein SS50377_18119 [Spironucleus salmonicida]
MHDLRQFEQFVHFQLGIFSLPHKLSYLLITISATLNSHYKLQLQTLLVSLLEVIVSGHHEERSCKCRPWKRFSDVLLAGARSAERNELDSIFWSFCGFWFWVCRGATGGFWTVWCNWVMQGGWRVIIAIWVYWTQLRLAGCYASGGWKRGRRGLARRLVDLGNTKNAHITINIAYYNYGTCVQMA